MAESNNFVSNLEHTARAIGNDVQAHPWDAVLALTHLPFDGGASAAQIATRAMSDSAAAKRAAKPAEQPAAAAAHASDQAKNQAKPSSLPDIQLIHSNPVAAVAQAAKDALHEVATNPLVALSLGPIGTSIYERYHIDTYVQSHGGVNNILPGLAGVGGALISGAINETVNHPADMAAAGASGAAISLLSRVPYVGGAIALGGIGYVGYQVYKHGGEWLHDADVTYYHNGRNATEIKNANTGLQHDGEGLALMGAGGVGAGLGGAVVSGVEGMLARQAVAASARAAAAGVEGAAETGTTAGSLASRNLEAGGQRQSQSEATQTFHAANENPQVIRMHSANENEDFAHQAQAVNGSPTGGWYSSGSGDLRGTTWADARVGNANQDRYVTPEDRAHANIAHENAEKEEENSMKFGNFRDLGLENFGKLGVQVGEILAERGIHTTKELTHRSEQELLDLPQISERIIAVIKEALAKKGLHLTSEVPAKLVAPANSEFNNFEFTSQVRQNKIIVNILHKAGIGNFDDLAAKFNSGELQKVHGMGADGISNALVRLALVDRGYHPQ